MKGIAVNNLALRVLWVFDKRTTSGWTDIRQTTDVHTFYWIAGGEGTFVDEKGTNYRVRKGHLVYLKPGFHLHMSTDADNPLRIIMVLTEIGYLPYEQRVWGSVEPLAALPFLILRAFASEQAKVVDKIFQSLIDGWIPGEQGGTVRDQLKLLELIQFLHANPEEELKDRPAQEAYVQMKNYLETHHAANIKLSELAARYGISESYSRKMFLKQLQQTPKQYLQSIRVGHAKQLLVFTDMSMRDIAQACGYGDEFHFSKMFKSLTGTAPSVFRESRSRG
ncbi:helix-turn-helix transcriptional regulator [Paenibacillus roseipurpureus]|uniref:AraC family transcriptional regulator n=1 Tax=Paenibacillus roseopurpureus TaxID=2918901 RepID=A0AA96LQC4_9BACL|nr:AraC family transcriptional regulator [Paenibacillus sp. MBLB1832]WNR45209.1 AraC family transcriptional regulator [Paenibacillus sp. MBLB1832]